MSIPIQPERTLTLRIAGAGLRISIASAADKAGFLRTAQASRLRGDSPSPSVGQGVAGLERAVSRHVARGLHLRRCERRLPGHAQSSPASLTQTGRPVGIGETYLPSDPAHDRDAGAEEGGTIKDVQGQLGHSRAATTTDVYMQEIPENVRTTVNAINAELRVKPEEIHPD